MSLRARMKKPVKRPVKKPVKAKKPAKKSSELFEGLEPLVVDVQLVIDARGYAGGAHITVVQDGKPLFTFGTNAEHKAPHLNCVEFYEGLSKLIDQANSKPQKTG